MTTSFMCLGGHQYEIDGWRFEWHSYCGPAPIDANGDPINSVSSLTGTPTFEQ